MRQTSRSGTKVGYSDPVVLYGRAIAHRIKVTIGITGLSPPRVHIDGEVWHLDGLGCSPIKAARELGSERRETVRSISGTRVRDLNGVFLSTRGPGRGDLQCTGYPAKGKRPVAVFQADKC